MKQKGGMRDVLKNKFLYTHTHILILYRVKLDGILDISLFTNRLKKEKKLSEEDIKKERINLYMHKSVKKADIQLREKKKCFFKIFNTCRERY